MVTRPQFGGLWIRRLKRFRDMKRKARPSQENGISLGMVPYKEDPEGPESVDDITERVINKTGLHKQITALKRDMSMVKRHSVDLNRRQSVEMRDRHMAEASRPSFTDFMTAAVGKGLSRISHEKKKIRNLSKFARPTLGNGAPAPVINAFTGEPLVSAPYAPPGSSSGTDRGQAPAILPRVASGKQEGDDEAQNDEGPLLPPGQLRAASTSSPGVQRRDPGGL